MQSTVAIAPAHSRQLTEKQQAFVKHYVAGVPQGKAAELAGYEWPDQQAVALLRHAGILAAIHATRESIIATDIGNLALARLREALQPNAMPRKDQFPYVKLGLQMAKHLKDQDNSRDGGKRLEEMAPEELAEVIARTEAELAGRARDVTPGSAPDNARPVDPSSDPAA